MIRGNDLTAVDSLSTDNSTLKSTHKSIKVYPCSSVAKVLALPEVRNPIVSQVNDIAASTPRDFTAYFRAEMNKWAKVIKTAGVRNE